MDTREQELQKLRDGQAQNLHELRISGRGQGRAFVEAQLSQNQGMKIAGREKSGSDDLAFTKSDWKDYWEIQNKVNRGEILSRPERRRYKRHMTFISRLDEKGLLQVDVGLEGQLTPIDPTSELGAAIEAAVGQQAAEVVQADMGRDSSREDVGL